MTLMDQEMFAQYVERDPRQVHLEQASCLVTPISRESFVTPVMDMRERELHSSNLNKPKTPTRHRRLF
jgi:hypothetical protein